MADYPGCAVGKTGKVMADATFFKKSTLSGAMSLRFAAPWALPCIFILCYLSLSAQAPVAVAKKRYDTRPVPAGRIQLDGKLDEAAWEQVAWGGDFTEHQPDQGTPPSQQTQFKIIFDDKYLYVGYRCFDSAPDSLIRRMSRRDEFPGEWIEINIDSYHDLRTAFSFTLSLSGVRGDEYISNNGNNWDTNWNPVWDGQAQTDSLGWTAEIKIPFSQLRYGSQSEPVWGIQVHRRIFRKEERSVWQFIPPNAGGWVSEFGELHGLRQLPTNQPVELAPYVVAKTDRFAREAGNPFADGSKQQLTGGLDGKVGITRDLILDFTVNPDFGQVEADPGAVRLDGYQVFFREQRPFFMESRNLFDYQLTGSEAGGDYDSDLLFYSRRIGGAPHGYPDLQGGEYADVPTNTSILGAAKFSGKTAKGLSVGILECVTQRERARIDRGGERRSEMVEPLTNFFLSRLMKDYDQGNTIIGGVFSAVNRERDLGLLHRSAYSGGLDAQHFWKNRWWYVRGNLLFSRVNGSEAAILATQTSFTHHFQRSNARHLEVDGTRTSLTGHGGTFRIGKTGGHLDSLGGVFKFESGVTWRSPELELNDAGFMQAADEINHFTWLGYQIQKPFSVFRNARINYNHWTRWDFGGQFLYSAFNTNIHGWFGNNWRVGTGLTYNPLDISNNALRGGSSLRRPAGMSHFAYLNTDDRKKVVVGTNLSYAWGFGGTIREQHINFRTRFQLLDAMQLSLNPGYGRSWRKQDQFVSQAQMEGRQRTIVSEVEQRNFSLTTRFSYNLTPELTIQYYGQPFIFRALYKNYGFVTDPLNRDYDARFHRYTAAELRTENNNFVVDENADGNTDYTFGQPDFNFIQFRSNLVVRWEYVPGSELFLVWSQGSSPDVAADLDSPLLGSLFSNVFSEQSRNVLLLKCTYRFLR
jgi:Domain of unknown function (DUF5916)/Carbohydrate family 9 binding domain-like